MSDCGRSREISAYHDGELSREESLGLEAHLAQCASCARELEELEAVARALADASIPRVPGDVLERLHGTVAVARERVLVSMAELLTAAAAAVLLLCAGWAFRGAGGGEAPAATPSAWELAAVGVREDSSSSEAQGFAQWMVRDLSVENAHD
ncbi:MAG: zf-HC2 domain-containing protein [Planctomycetota bacterium]